MADPKNDQEAMFPTLDEAQLAKLETYGTRRSAKPGDILWNQGDPLTCVFVVVSGSLDIVNPSQKDQPVIVKHTPGHFSGEINMLSGRNALVQGRVTEPSEFIEIDHETLRKIVQTDPPLGDVFLRAFVMRRLALLEGSTGDIIIIGSSHSSDTLRLREFLGRNGHPHRYVDVDHDSDVQSMLDHFHVKVEEIPVVVCRNTRVLRNPSNAEIAECLGFNADVDEKEIVDVIVVGAGPSGLAAAVYAASEGLNVLVLETSAPGGQAGTSSRIENYLGFPMGVSGQELAGRAFVQAQKFGAKIAIALTAQQLVCARQPYAIRIDNGNVIQGRSVILAMGVTYRSLELSDIKKFEGAGIYYAATNLESQVCHGEEIAIVGGGNSAGQAAVFLAEHSKHVYLLVRGEGLSETMSRYLIRRIEENSNITLLPHTEVEALEGESCLQRVRWRNSKTGEVETRPVGHLFLMTGAIPNTEWLNGCVALDDKKFVKTGPDIQRDELKTFKWPNQRQPYLLETSLPQCLPSAMYERAA